MGEGPICDLIRAYRDGAFLRLHMPGHKGRGGAESLDVTEIRGLSPLYPASGAVLESEENAAALFGAGRRAPRCASGPCWPWPGCGRRGREFRR